MTLHSLPKVYVFWIDVLIIINIFVQSQFTRISKLQEVPYVHLIFQIKITSLTVPQLNFYLKPIGKLNHTKKG